jgi:glutathione-independent formaldehyde dehydrogenase
MRLVRTSDRTPDLACWRQLWGSGLRGKAQVAKAVSATAIWLERAVQGYTDFDKGAAKKFVLDPHGMLGTTA